jgi:hypothetical protein
VAVVADVVVAEAEVIDTTISSNSSNNNSSKVVHLPTGRPRVTERLETVCVWK